MAQSKTTTNPAESQEARDEGTYEQIHAVVQELSYLMGVRPSDPMSHPLPSGYGVYTYPMANTTYPFANQTYPMANPPTRNAHAQCIWAGPQMFTLPSMPYGHPVIADQFRSALTSTPSYSAWGQYPVAMSFP